jgi:hypothetical protein
MKKLRYLPLLALIFTACQKQNYVSSIPAPAFHHYTSGPVSKPIAAPNFETSAATAPSPEIIASSTPAFTFPISESTSGSIVETKVNAVSSNTNSANPNTKTTQKQRVVKRFVERKITKMSAQQNSNPKARRSDGIAVTSFIAAILGIVGLFTTGWLFLIGMVAAIVLGFIGLGRIRRSNGELGGRGWAIGGLVLGFIELLLLILGVLFVAAFIGAFGA